jgi:hypothetical protein
MYVVNNVHIHTYSIWPDIRLAATLCITATSNALEKHDVNVISAVTGGPQRDDRSCLQTV